MKYLLLGTILLLFLILLYQINIKEGFNDAGPQEVSLPIRSDGSCSDPNMLNMFDRFHYADVYNTNINGPTGSISTECIYSNTGLGVNNKSLCSGGPTGPINTTFKYNPTGTTGAIRTIYYPTGMSGSNRATYYSSENTDGEFIKYYYPTGNTASNQPLCTRNLYPTGPTGSVNTRQVTPVLLPLPLPIIEHPKLTKVEKKSKNTMCVIC